MQPKRELHNMSEHIQALTKWKDFSFGEQTTYSVTSNQEHLRSVETANKKMGRATMFLSRRAYKAALALYRIQNWKVDRQFFVFHIQPWNSFSWWNVDMKLHVGK